MMQNNKKNFIKIGLTGGIGSGKSTISSILREKGIKIIDADVISREVLNIYDEINYKIRKAFGESFFDENGKLRRRELGNFIFKDQNKIKKMDEIMIPYIKEEIMKRFDKFRKNGEELCVLDAPTLIEHNMHEIMDINILVWVDYKTQIERVKKRDNLNTEQVLNRISSQMSLNEKKKYADYIIDNSKDLKKTKAQLNIILNNIERLKYNYEKI